MTDIRRIGEAGVHTIEGNIAGDLAAQFTKEREKQQQEYEVIKNKIKAANNAVVGKINDKFNSAVDNADQEFRKKTVGLVSADDFRKASEEATNAQKAFQESQLLEKQKSLQHHVADEEVRAKTREDKRKKTLATLSFGMEEDNNDDDEVIIPKKKSKNLKNPNVDTSFLPDPRREKEIELQKEQLKKEWLEKQELIKAEVSLGDFPFCLLIYFFVLAT
jgi:protein FAM50